MKDLSYGISMLIDIKQAALNAEIGTAEYDFFQSMTHCGTYIDDDDAVPTLIAGHRDLWLRNGHGISRGDIISAQTFPQDYDFGSDKYGDVEYMCGMSVPPVMMKRIVQRLIINGVFKYKGVTI